LGEIGDPPVCADGEPIYIESRSGLDILRLMCRN